MPFNIPPSYSIVAPATETAQQLANEKACVSGGGVWIDTLVPYPRIVTSDGQEYNAAVHNGGCVFIPFGAFLVISLNPKVTS